MCVDPLTAAMLLAGGSGVMKAYGAYTGHRMEAEGAISNAQQVEEVGYRNELTFRDQARREIAEQTARLAANGGSIGSGTPLLLLAESAKNKELDALAIRRNALMEGRAYRYSASVHRFAAPLSAAGELLSAGASVAALGALGGGAPAAFDPASGNWTPGPGGFPGG
jgi:hypothetical protein